MNAPSSKPPSGRRTLWLIAAVCLAPIVASYAAYYFFPRESQVNYGKLLAMASPTIPEGQRADGSPFRLDQLRGRWIMVMVANGGCDDACARKLYAMRQAQTMQGREQDRVVRAWLLTGDAAPNAAILAEHPGLVVARVPADALDRWPDGPAAIYLVDPLGNLVLSYPDNPDIKGIGRDLARLLKASRIG